MSSSAPIATAAPESSAARAARVGALSAGLCYFCWGIVPLYWKQLAHVSSIELIAHRHVWSLVFLLGVLAAQGALGTLVPALRGARALAINFVAACLLTVNWSVYVWGVNTGHVIECSLGYFLVPLVNVGVGCYVLHEKLRRAQWIAIGLAALGVVVLVIQIGRPPWIALALAGSWGGYSLMRKKSPLGALTGLTAETIILAPLAAGFLLWQQSTGAGALGHTDARTQVLVLSAGIITAIPLVLFGYGARRIRLSTLGLLQYIAPSVQFIIGVWIYHEPFPRSRMISFAFIWMGLALYTADNLLAVRRASATAS